MKNMLLPLVAYLSLIIGKGAN